TQAPPLPEHSLFAGLDVEAPATATAPTLTMQTRGGRTIDVPPPATAPQQLDVAESAGESPTHTQAYVIDSEQALAQLIRRLRKAGAADGFALDTETDSLDPLQAKLVGISVAAEPGIAYYIPVGHEQGTQLQREQVLEQLRLLLEDTSLRKVAHN